MNIHEKFINRCIEIAKNAHGRTAPNPMVGCVIVSNCKIIAEGITSTYGGHHAEVNAINAVADKSLLKNATLYVTLEPCSHFGKTPPCSDLIIRSRIPQVVIGCKDDNKKVSGKGIKKLRDAGCNVLVGILEQACLQHHRRFFTFHNKKRPYIILKWAKSADGFMAPLSKKEKKPVWLTNIYSRQLVHKWRAEEQAILVGFNTVIQDNPSLTTRDWKGENPIRVVLDNNNTLSKKYKVFNNEASTLVIQESTAEAICDALYNNNIISIIIEGGAKTLQLFIDAGLWDEARIFSGSNNLITGIKSPEIVGTIASETTIDTDHLKILVND